MQFHQYLGNQSNTWVVHRYLCYLTNTWALHRYLCDLTDTYALHRIQRWEVIHLSVCSILDMVGGVALLKVMTGEGDAMCEKSEDEGCYLRPRDGRIR